MVESSAVARVLDSRQLLVGVRISRSMKDISGHEPGPLADFELVLKRWIKANKKYCEVSKWEDVPWGYNERASLSTFAAAAWLAGGVALEEYSEEKDRAGSARGRKKQRKGRCDLYVDLRGKRGAYIMEAKILWPSLETSDWERPLLKTLNKARGEAKETRAHNNEKKAGLLFVSPYIRNSKDSPVEKSIFNLVQFLRSRKDICSAWTFPAGSRGFYWDSEKRWLYPGTAVLLMPR